MPDCRMLHRNWRETKQQPSRDRSGHQNNCCLVSFPPSPVRHPAIGHSTICRKLGTCGHDTHFGPFLGNDVLVGRFGPDDLVCSYLARSPPRSNCVLPSPFPPECTLKRLAPSSVTENARMSVKVSNRPKRGRVGPTSEVRPAY